MTEPAVAAFAVTASRAPVGVKAVETDWREVAPVANSFCTPSVVGARTLPRPAPSASTWTVVTMAAVPDPHRSWTRSDEANPLSWTWMVAPVGPERGSSRTVGRIVTESDAERAERSPRAMRSRGPPGRSAVETLTVNPPLAWASTRPMTGPVTDPDRIVTISFGR